MNKKLDICVLNDSFPPAIDGVGNVVFNYARVFTKDGIHVVVSTPEYPNSKDEYDFKVLRYPSINTIDKIGYTTGFPFDLSYITKLKENPMDIIHVHCPMTSMFLARVLRDSIHKPVIFTYHTKYDIDIRRTIKDSFLQEKAIQAIVKNISACDEVWAVSRGAADNLKSLGYQGDILIMENGVDMPKGKVSDEEIQLIKEEFHLKEGIPAYLFVGRMMWYKGIQIILDALKKLKEAGKDFQMVFIGSGIELESIKEYCSSLDLDDKVIFGGPVYDRHKLKCIFSSFDVFLFPSTFDTNGLVVREAASSGLASILVEGSCAAEDTINYQNALWIQENSDSLYEVLFNTDIESLHTIGMNAMDELYISWEDACHKAYKRYEKVLDSYEYKQRFGISDDAFNMISDMSVLYGDIHEFVHTRHAMLRTKRKEIREDLMWLKEQIDDDMESITHNI